MARIVTLTTDFGTGSAYVAELKGRLFHARSVPTVIDISHDLPPHDVWEAAWLVAAACPAFPSGSLHLVVVDPGVGTSRRLLWARVGDQEYLAPDNGVLSRLFECPSEAAPIANVASNPMVFRSLAIPSGASATFHGRDAIAPAAVHLLEGHGPESLGPIVDDEVRLVWPQPRGDGHDLVGEVMHVDRFGNLVTNLPDTLFERLIQAGSIRVGHHAVRAVVRTYGEATPGTIVALAGSQGFLEVAVVQGRADRALGAARGTLVTLPAVGRQASASRTTSP